MADELAEIKAKCEQYMGYHGESVGMAEVHAILSFIHTRTIGAIAEVERLEGKYVEAAKLADERRQTLRQKQDEIYLLTNKVEQHKAWKERHLDTVLMAQTCGKLEGMEAAAKVVREHPYCTNQETLAKAIDAAAKEQTGKAGSREQAGPPDNCPLCGRPHDLILDEDGNVLVASPANTPTHRDGGDAKETT